MKYTKMIALASALCTAFTCSNAAFTASCVTEGLPENTFEYENVYMQIVSDQHSSKPHLVVTGFTKEALQSDCQSESILLPSEIDTGFMPPFEGTEEYGALPVTEIGANAFRFNKALEHVWLPYTIEKINNNAFEGCINLLSVEFNEDDNEPSKLKVIDDFAFYKCEKLSNIILPESLQQINGAAFAFCNGLKQIKVPAEFIDGDAFAFCSNLEDVYILRGNTRIYPNTFYNDAVSNPQLHEIIEHYLFYGTIHGYRGSTAQEYAEEYKCNFEYLSYLDKDAGDLDGDSKVTVADAQLALREYTTATVAGGKSTLTFQQRKNGDINRDGAVGVEDAQLILKYYVTNTLAGTPASWEDLLYGKVTIDAPEKPVTTPAVTTTTAPAVTTSTMPATSAAPVQTTSAPAVTTAAAATTAPALTTVTAATSVPPVTTTTTVVTVRLHCG